MFVVHFYSAISFHDMFQISRHSSQKPLIFTHRWISIKFWLLMRYLWPLLLAYNGVNVNVCASNLHELEKSFVCQPVSLF